MKVAPILFVGLCSIAPALCAQFTDPTASLNATTMGKISLAHPIGIGTAIAMCDAAGNVYLQQLPGPRGPGLMINRPPVEEISADAKKTVTFQLPDHYAGDVETAFVDHGGKVYLVQRARSGIYVVEFAPDGSIKARTKLKLEGVDVQRLAVFKSGEYLLVGLTGKDRRTPFTAVFSADGQLLRTIYEPEDEEARQRAAVDGWQYTHLGDLDVGTDGNVYLLHGGPRPIVFVISAAGDVIRKLRIDPEGHRFSMGNIKFHSGQLAIRFDEQTESEGYLIKVIDTQGNSIMDYRVGGGNSNTLALACYDSDGLVMLRETATSDTTESELELVRAKLP